MFKKQWSQISGSIRLRLLVFTAFVTTIALAIFAFIVITTQRAALTDSLEIRGQNLAIIGAATVGHIFEDAIETNRLTKEEVFDTNYQLIPGTNPPKYHTAYDHFTDANILAIQDAFLSGEETNAILLEIINPLVNESSANVELFFAVAMDKNGYIPTHNSVYSQTLTGNFQADLKSNRTKRKLSDDATLRAAKNTGLSIIQQYTDQETGERILDISAPIMVNGEHWGAFRVGILQDRITSSTNTTAIGTIVLVAVMVIVSTFASFLLARSFANPILALRDAATVMAGGDLTKEIPRGNRRDEVDQLATALRNTVVVWREIIGSLRDDAVHLSTTAAELASSAEQLSRTTTAQSDEVSRTSSAVEEMAFSIREVAQNAELAAHATTNATQRAEGGGLLAKDTTHILEEADEIMGRLRTYSDKIDSIVNLIQDIAAQTNILALNAAIEAAGAGVAGARFDVVAEEIRKLASRTHQATGEIVNLIGNVQTEIQGAAEAITKGTSLAKESGSSLTDIVYSSNAINDMVQAISTATAQQSRTSGEIANAVETMVDSSQQTVTATRETAEIGIELSNLAERLKDAANRFKV